MELRESVLKQIIMQKRENSNAHGLTARDDASMISKLEMDALSISITIKVKRQEYELLTKEENNSQATLEIGETQACDQPYTYTNILEKPSAEVVMHLEDYQAGEPTTVVVEDPSTVGITQDLVGEQSETQVVVAPTQAGIPNDKPKTNILSFQHIFGYLNNPYVDPLPENNPMPINGSNHTSLTSSPSQMQNFPNNVTHIYGRSVRISIAI